MTAENQISFEFYKLFKSTGKKALVEVSFTLLESWLP